MTGAELAMDLLLAASLLFTACFLLMSGDFLRTAVLFIGFGLFMSLAWVRLEAPDIALAEAAIGAGVTGVLLMDAIRHMEWGKEAWSEKWPRHRKKGAGLRLPSRIGLAAVVAALGGLLLAGVAHLADRRPGLARAVTGGMGELEHPVTAVLLVFRSLDTWLELGILLLAVVGMLASRGRPGLGAALLAPPRDPILEGVVRVLVPLAVLTAAYFMWLGTFSAGGAFQSGVVLGSAAMLLWLSGHPSINALPQWLWRLLMLLGFAAMTLAALITLLLSEWMLQYPESPMLAFIKAIETAAAVSIGACLAGLFVGQHPGLGAFDRAPFSGRESRRG